MKVKYFMKTLYLPKQTNKKYLEEKRQQHKILRLFDSTRTKSIIFLSGKKTSLFRFLFRFELFCLFNLLYLMRSCVHKSM